MSEAYPDVEVDLRDWAQALGITGIGSRVYLRPSKEVNAACITVNRVAGGEDVSDGPLDVPLIQWDIWGDVRSRPAARRAANELRTALRSIPDVVGTTRVFERPEIIDDRFLPDPDDPRPRYAITARFVTAHEPTS